MAGEYDIFDHSKLDGPNCLTKYLSGTHEEFAFNHAEQWLGCIECKGSHHKTAFCPDCGSCFFQAEVLPEDPRTSDFGTFVRCKGCHKVQLWD